MRYTLQYFYGGEVVSIYEWYIDVFFMVNFLMDAAGLFAAGVLCNRKIRLVRILPVCVVTTACSILLLLYLPSYIWYLLSVHLVLNPLMVLVCYRPGSWWDFLRPLLAVYLVLFLAGGVQQSLRLYGMSSTGQILISGLFAIGMFLVREMRWRVLRRVCPVELEFSGEHITITAFCDSGNLLRDPDSGNAVNVIKRSALPESWLPAGEWRRIPYRTVGADEGEIEIITLDKMRIYKKGRVREVEKPVLGLFDGTLLAHPRVELLLNGAYA